MEVNGIGAGQETRLDSPSPAAGLPVAGASDHAGHGVTVSPPSVPDVQGARAAPAMFQGTAVVGGPWGLVLSVMPSASVGFASAAADPPLLRRAGKSKMFVGQRTGHRPIVINMEAALRAVAGKLRWLVCCRRTRSTPRQSSATSVAHGSCVAVQWLRGSIARTAGSSSLSRMRET